MYGGPFDFNDNGRMDPFEASVGHHVIFDVFGTEGGSDDDAWTTSSRTKPKASSQRKSALDAWLNSSGDDGFNRATDSWSDVLESEYPWTSKPSAAGSWCGTIDDEDDDSEDPWAADDDEDEDLYFHTYVAGTKFDNHDVAWSHAEFTYGLEIDLVREPNNEYDPNAIAVYADGLHGGYVPADVASTLADLMDSGWEATASNVRISIDDDREGPYRVRLDIRAHNPYA
ncbi:HIRAN domain-containing protein [Slackia heliotrinireducens]|uniref:HIRAN domain-containing protein n=1 Tax=Slackia heliotrinireducens TaxID=84110 RepID=UPI0033163393